MNQQDMDLPNAPKGPILDSFESSIVSGSLVGQLQAFDWDTAIYHDFTLFPRTREELEMLQERPLFVPLTPVERLEKRP